MQAKLFMIPWLLLLIELAIAQPRPTPPPTPSAQSLTNDLLVDAHHRHFYEMLRRQQQINDALLIRNNALLHQLPQLHHNPPPPPPQLFNPFAQQQPSQGSTSKLGTYGSEDVEDDEKEGTVEAPQRSNDDVKKKTSLAGVKTVSIKRKEESEDVVETTTTVSLSAEDLEVVQLFKKLNLSKEEAKSIVDHVEQVVREKLSSTTTTTSTTSTTSTTTPTVPTTTTTTPQENLVLHRNQLKHHPIRLHRENIIHPTSDEASDDDLTPQGSIKTSLKHLPIIVANEEEETTSTTMTSPAETSGIHKRIRIASHDREAESDRDLLVDFATGAPLDLAADEVTRGVGVGVVTITTTSTLAPPRSTTTLASLPPRQTHHEVTNFERLATDYRRRLEHTGDINTILQKISENAYISLVERGGPRKLFGV